MEPLSNFEANLKEKTNLVDFNTNLRTKYEIDDLSDMELKLFLHMKDAKIDQKQNILNTIEAKYSFLDDFVCREMALISPNFSQPRVVDSSKERKDLQNIPCILKGEAVLASEASRQTKISVLKEIYALPAETFKNKAVISKIEGIFAQAYKIFGSDRETLHLLVKIASKTQNIQIILIVADILEKSRIRLRNNCLIEIKPIEEHSNVFHFLDLEEGLLVSQGNKITNLSDPERTLVLDSVDFVFLKENGDKIDLYGIKAGYLPVISLFSCSKHLESVVGKGIMANIGNPIENFSFEGNELSVKFEDGAERIIAEIENGDFVVDWVKPSLKANLILKQGKLEVFKSQVEEEILQIYSLPEEDLFASEGVDLLGLIMKRILHYESQNCYISSILAETLVSLLQIGKRKFVDCLRVLLTNAAEIEGEASKILISALTKLNSKEARELLHYYFGIEIQVDQLKFEEKLKKGYKFDDLEQAENLNSREIKEQLSLTQKNDFLSKTKDKISIRNVICSLETVELEQCLTIFKQNVAPRLDYKEICLINISAEKGETGKFSLHTPIKGFLIYSLGNKRDETFSLELDSRLVKIHQGYNVSFSTFKYTADKAQNVSLLVSEQVSEQFSDIPLENHVEFKLLSVIFTHFQQIMGKTQFSEGVDKIIKTRLLNTVNTKEKEINNNFANLSNNLEKMKFTMGGAEKARKITEIVNILFMTFLKNQNMLSSIGKTQDKGMLKQIFSRFEGLRQWIFLRKGMFVSDSTEETERRVKEDLKILEERAKFLLNAVQPEETINPSFSTIKTVSNEIILIFKSTSITVRELRNAVKSSEKRANAVLKVIQTIEEIFKTVQDCTVPAFLYVNCIKNSTTFSFYRSIGCLSPSKGLSIKKASISLITCLFDRIFASDSIKEQLALIHCLFATYSGNEIVKIIEKDYIYKLIGLVSNVSEENESNYFKFYNKISLKSAIKALVDSIILQIGDKMDLKPASDELNLTQKVSILSENQEEAFKSFIQAMFNSYPEYTITLLNAGFTANNEENLIIEIQNTANFLERVELTTNLIYKLKTSQSALKYNEMLKNLIKGTVLPFNQEGELTQLLGEKRLIKASKGDEIPGEDCIFTFLAFHDRRTLIDYPSKYGYSNKPGEKYYFSEELFFDSELEFDLDSYDKTEPVEHLLDPIAGLTEWNLYFTGKIAFFLNKYGFIKLYLDSEMPKGWFKGHLKMKNDNLVVFEGERSFSFRSLAFDKESENEIWVLPRYFRDFYSYLRKEAFDLTLLEESFKQSLSLRKALRNRTGDFNKVVTGALKEIFDLDEQSLVMTKLLAEYLKHRKIEDILLILGDIPESIAPEVLETTDFSDLDDSHKVGLLCSSFNGNYNISGLRRRMLSLTKDIAVLPKKLEKTALLLEEKAIYKEEYDFINYARNVLILREGRDLCFENKNIVEMLKESDSLILDFNQESLMKLKTTYFKKLDILPEIQQYSVNYGNSDRSKLTLVELKVPVGGGMLSFDYLKIDETVLVFADKEGTELIDFFSYFDPSKELRINSRTVYVSLPFTGFKTKIDNGELETDQEESNIWHLFYSNGLIIDNKQGITSVDSVLDNKEIGKITVRLNNIFKDLGEPKHMTVNYSTVALITQEDSLFSFNLTDFEDLKPPISVKEVGEIVQIVALKDSIAILTRSNKLYFQGKSFGDLFEKDSMECLTEVKPPEGRIVNIYGFVGEVSDRIIEIFQITLENEGEREFYALQTGTPKTENNSYKLVKLPLSGTVSSFRVEQGHNIFINSSGGIESYEIFDPKLYSLRYNFDCITYIPDDFGIVDSFSVHDFETSSECFDANLTYIKRIGNKKEIVHDNKTSVESDEFTPLRVKGTQKACYVIKVDKKLKYPLEALKQGSSELKYYWRTEENTFSKLLPLNKAKIKEFLDIYGKNGVSVLEEKIEETYELPPEIAKILTNMTFNRVVAVRDNIYHGKKEFEPLLSQNLELFSDSLLFTVFDSLLTKTNFDESDEKITVNRKIAVEAVKENKIDIENKTLFNQLYSKNTFFSVTDGNLVRLEFEGEGGTDSGGLSREAYSQIGRELTSNCLDVFVPSPNKLSNYGEFRETFIINPKMTKGDYRLDFLGNLMAYGFHVEGIMELELNPVVWKSIVRADLTREDIKTVDKHFYDMLKRFEEPGLSEEEIEKSLNNQFVLNNLSGEQVVFKEGKVNLSNISEFVEEAEEYKLEELKEQGILIGCEIEFVFKQKLHGWRLSEVLEVEYAGK